MNLTCLLFAALALLFLLVFLWVFAAMARRAEDQAEEEEALRRLREP